MKRLSFKHSLPVSIGIELEFQVIDPKSFSLIARAKDLIRNIRESAYKQNIKPEVTQSMIEINSSIHYEAKEMLSELSQLQTFLLAQATNLQITFCGGGTHPFQKWKNQEIFPINRYKNLSRKFKYLAKRATVFGQHVHIGCPNAEDALYLTHALARFVPHFIAISASSPFYQGIDTGYYSSRSTIFNDFPSSGVIPYLTGWNDFSQYFYKMSRLGIIGSMKDLYWDIRPRPDFGTVEIRVCDTPLTLRKAILIVAYIQTLSLYLLEEKPININHNLYFLYNYNRFQASRYSFDGDFIDPNTEQRCSIINDILDTIKKIKIYAQRLNNDEFMKQLADDVNNKCNDAVKLKEILKRTGSFQHLVAEQCRIWSH
ncbi:carboxylate-amine ligase [Legionella santicrucis]|uniref:Putative glutamate--cysteine ligase 2 n=1 Tax=Legionella santicrucis TaxID=45074 RepID=A0A0W0YRU2_9GAMM|nr:YbdK family carboxylate-amine ligase [Legionella santicrucis]KTD59568.1 carboxylate-amine ligase [Legionella santicrucis]